MRGIDRHQTRARNGAATRRVTAERVVGPTHVAADVDHVAGHADLGHGVATGVVDPGRILIGGGGRELEAGPGVAQGVVVDATGVGAGGSDNEVLPVGSDVDIAHVGVEVQTAALRVARGRPGTQRRSIVGAGQVDLDDLGAALAVDVAEVSNRHQGLPVVRDVEVLDGDGSTVPRVGEGPRQGACVGAGHRIQRGQEATRLTVDSGEASADVELVVDQLHVRDSRVGGRRPEGRDDRSRGRVDPRHARGVGCAVHIGEASPDENGPVARVHDVGDFRGPHVWNEGSIDHAGGRVVGEDPAAGHRGTGGGGHGGETADRDDAGADLDEPVDLALVHIRREVLWVGRHDAVKVGFSMRSGAVGTSDARGQDGGTNGSRHEGLQVDVL